ncbi:threonine synthase [Halalkalirubrum salinum]|uniref:threonine synthase n=1 Tax=Halalkalirubrum salinum TaxID=2563889 RepID=UPI0010FB7A09|nr:pyridoxal-phosphate dependent enzyme [Halalkalirubrum salinum]
MAEALVCYRCGNQYPAVRQRCDCGEPLWYSTSPIESSLSLDGVSRSMWAYAPWLPVDRPVRGIAADVGGTPLHRLGAASGGLTMYLKNEGLHPTGSFKDRGSAVGVTAVADRGTGAIATVSHGNMAMSTAACAAGTPLDCYVFVPSDIPTERIEQIGQFGATIVRVEGPYGELYERSLELESDHNVTFVNSDSPLRTAGQKTTGMEIASEFATRPGLPSASDAIVLPVSSGGHASATWKGLCELRDAGLIERIPRLYLVQAAACAPIARAYDRSEPTVTAFSPDEVGETIAYSIANADPPSGTRALTAARKTEGAVLAVNDEEIRDAKTRLAREFGISVESSCATTLAAVDRLTETGELGTDEHVVLVGTGSGFKELTAGSGGSTAPTDVSIDDIASVFDDHERS